MDYSIGCPVVTPFDADGTLDTDSLASVVDHLVAGGVDRLVPCGTTGEFAALTDAEHRTVVETVVDAADGRATVMAGVGGTAVADVRGRIRAAASAGADAALVVAPYYGGQADPAGNERFFDAVAAGADLPLYLYNIPATAGQSLSVDTVTALAERGRYDGIKDSSGDLTYFDEVLARAPDGFEVLQGWDPGFVPTLLLGADGAICATTHIVPERFTAAAQAVAEGAVDTAREHQFEGIDPVARYCGEHGFAPVCKAWLADEGLLESATVRPPTVPMPDDERATLRERFGD